MIQPRDIKKPFEKIICRLNGTVGPVEGSFEGRIFRLVGPARRSPDKKARSVERLKKVMARSRQKTCLGRVSALRVELGCAQIIGQRLQFLRTCDDTLFQRLIGFEKLFLAAFVGRDIGEGRDIPPPGIGLPSIRRYRPSGLIRS